MTGVRDGSGSDEAEVSRRDFPDSLLSIDLLWSLDSGVLVRSRRTEGSGMVDIPTHRR